MKSQQLYNPLPFLGLVMEFLRTDVSSPPIVCHSDAMEFLVLAISLHPFLHLTIPEEAALLTYLSTAGPPICAAACHAVPRLEIEVMVKNSKQVTATRASWKTTILTTETKPANFDGLVTCIYCVNDMSLTWLKAGSC
jgi:hypothetical protein